VISSGSNTMERGERLTGEKLGTESLWGVRQPGVPHQKLTARHTGLQGWLTDLERVLLRTLGTILVRLETY
jgi:hypothetical protein